MSLKRKGIIISIICMILIFTGMVIYILSSDLQLTLIFIIIIVGCKFLVSIIINIYVSKINGMLYRQCDPKTFVDLMIMNYPEKNRDDDSMGIIYSIARGQIAAGRFEEALAELNYIKTFPEGSFSVSSKRFYYEYLVSIYIELKDITQAEAALAALKELTRNKEVNIFMKGTLNKQYEASALLLNMAKGNFEGAEDFFTRKFRRAKNNYDRVCAQYRLGEVYSHYGDTAKAKEAFKYAAEHGNKLYIAAQAREMLARL